MKCRCFVHNRGFGNKVLLITEAEDKEVKLDSSLFDNEQRTHKAALKLKKKKKKEFSELNNSAGSLWKP